DISSDRAKKRAGRKLPEPSHAPTHDLSGMCRTDRHHERQEERPISVGSYWAWWSAARSDRMCAAIAVFRRSAALAWIIVAFTGCPDQPPSAVVHLAADAPVR